MEVLFKNRKHCIRRLNHKIWANSLVFQSESSEFPLINSEFTLSRDKVRQAPSEEYPYSSLHQPTGYCRRTSNFKCYGTSTVLRM